MIVEQLLTSLNGGETWNSHEEFFLRSTSKGEYIQKLKRKDAIIVINQFSDRTVSGAVGTMIEARRQISFNWILHDRIGDQNRVMYAIKIAYQEGKQQSFSITSPAWELTMEEFKKSQLLGTIVEEMMTKLNTTRVCTPGLEMTQRDRDRLGIR